MAMESNLAGGYIDFARFSALRDTAAHDKQQALDGVAEEAPQAAEPAQKAEPPQQAPEQLAKGG